MTSFDEIYDVFLSQINDPDFLNEPNSDELMLRYLKNSIPKFNKSLKLLSDRTDTEFNSDLTDTEILILGTLMVVEYCQPQIMTIENLRHAMSWKDYSFTSQANHITALVNLRDSKKKEANKLMLDYAYDNAFIEKLR